MIEVGGLVSSLQGHDIGRNYIVIKIEGDFAYCADGKYRPLSNPKKKRIKHLSNLHKTFKGLTQKLDNNKLYDFEISTFINNESIMHKD